MPIAKPRYEQFEQASNLFPIGSVYIQLPTFGATGKTNTKATAFPVAEEPAALFGGTWQQQFEDEGITFKTEGDALSQTDGENNVRTNGLQTDMMQQITGSTGDTALLGNNANKINYSGAITLSDGTGAGRTGTSNNSIKISFDSANSPDARTGKETRMRNRLMKVWRRTS